MKLDFNQVTFDGDLEDASEEDLRELIATYEDAQEDNAAEFEAAKETLDEVEDVNVEEFHDARADLIETITEYESFEDAPLTEDDLEDSDFARLREYDDYFGAQDAASDEEDGEFSDMGTESPEDENETSDAEFFEDALGDVPGVAPQ